MKKSGNKLIVVLGMHRSGTSVVTCGLQVMGVELGNRLMPPFEGNNEKGFWEDIDLNSLNIEMLNFLNSDWHFLTPIQPADVSALHRNGYLLRAVEMLKEKTLGIQIFGFKDPRVVKLLLFWKEAFVQSRLNVSYVLIVRHPLSVCNSLAKRDGFDFEKSHQLWLEHVVSSLIGTAGENRILVDYDRLMQSPDTELIRIAKRLQLHIDPRELERFKTEFFDKELRHTIYQLKDLMSDESIPPLVREVYSEVLKAAIDGELLDGEILKNKIAQWNNEFSRQRSALVLIDKLTSKIMSINQALAERDGQIASLYYEKEQTVREFSSQVQTFSTHIDGLTTQLTQMQEIANSKAWKLMLILRRVRSSLLPSKWH